MLTNLAIHSETGYKACLDYIKSTFGAMCIEKLRECQNVLNNQFKGILGKLHADSSKK